MRMRSRQICTTSSCGGERPSGRAGGRVGDGHAVHRTGLRRARGRQAVAAPSRPRRASSGSISGSRPRRSRNACIGSSEPPRDEQPRAERRRRCARSQAAVLAEPLDRVGVEDLGPDVRVVPGRVAAGEDVVEVGGPVPGRHRGVVDAGTLQGGRLERLDLLDVRRDLVGRQPVPRLVEQRGREVLRGREPLAVLAGGQQRVHPLRGHRLARLVVPRERPQDRRVPGPHLVDLRRVLDEVPRDARCRTATATAPRRADRAARDRTRGTA